MVAADVAAYEHSWGYVIQATRNGGMVWHDPVGCRLVFFCRKPDQPDTLVVPTFFAEPELLARLIGRAQMFMATNRTIVKNIDPACVHKYSSLGFCPYRADEAWSAEARFDDQTYPQAVIDLSQLTVQQGREYRGLRKALRYGDRAGYQMRPYREADRKAVVALLELRDEPLGIPQFRDAHAVYLEADLPRFVAEVDGRLAGFAATSRISEVSAALCAGIFDRRFRSLAAWAHYRIMASLGGSGFETVNLGGSEALGTMRFKQLLFRPCRTIPRVHLVFT